MTKQPLRIEAEKGILVMVKKINSKLEALTQDLAKQFAEMPALPGEWERKPGRISFFQKHLAGHTFIDPTWSQGLCKADGKTYRLDGQHSSFVLASHETTAENPFPDLMVTIQMYEFDSLEEDGAALFDIFDNPASVRTDVDIMGVYRAGYDELKELPRKYLDHVGKGIRFYQSSMIEDGDVIDRRHKGSYFSTKVNRDFAVWLHQFVPSKHDWLVSKDGVVGEMYADYQYNAVLAQEFWSQVFFESNPDPDHITRDLSSTLKDWARSAKRKTSIQFHKLTKKTWDSYRKMAELQQAA